MKLVIVESPNKVKTIQKYLGNDYKVAASVGHIVHMKTEGQDNLGIDFDKWEPLYEISSEKEKIVKELKELASKADLVYIATDPDREGEAIGDNLIHFLKINNKYKRIKYNEISKTAIIRAIENAEMIDKNLVEAQKTRRMLDRIIGFKLSNLIASKIGNSPSTVSAGRVQSIGLKLVVDRDKEINEFKPVPYSIINANINDEMIANWFDENNQEFENSSWLSRDRANQIVNSLDKKLNVVSVERETKEDSRKEPLKQSVLYKKSPLSAKATQQALQNLFEGYGEHGLITYPRTDSTRIAPEFIEVSKAFIVDKFGANYFNEKVRSSSGDQDAHEAIRPVSFELTPDNAKSKYSQMSNDDYKIYDLIYKLTLQALLKPSIKDNLKVVLENNNQKFKMSFTKIVFDGYLIIDKSSNKTLELPDIKEGDILEVSEYQIKDSQTSPPSKYNDGSLISKLDKIKVGRPSTFASTVDVIQKRKFVVKDKEKMSSTELGRIVLDKLLQGFPNEINETYTAKVESDLDLIAEGKKTKNEVMEQFWTQFINSFDNASNTLTKTFLKDKRIDHDCPQCNNPLVIKKSKAGNEFIGCSNWPNCNYVEWINTTPATKGRYKK